MVIVIVIMDYYFLVLCRTYLFLAVELLAYNCNLTFKSSFSLGIYMNKLVIPPASLMFLDTLVSPLSSTATASYSTGSIVDQDAEDGLNPVTGWVWVGGCYKTDTYI